MEIPFRCSHCVLGAANGSGRGVWSCACLLSGTGRAPTRGEKNVNKKLWKLILSYDSQSGVILSMNLNN